MPPEGKKSPEAEDLGPEQAGGTSSAPLPESELAQPVEASVVVTPVGSEGATPRRPATRRAPGQSTARNTPVAAKKRSTASLAPALEPPLRPTTLAIDIGGTGLKVSCSMPRASLSPIRVRVATPYPCTTKVMMKALVGLVAPLPAFDRISAGFPGVVRKGLVLTAPHFVTKTGAPGEPVVGKLHARNGPASTSPRP